MPIYEYGCTACDHAFETLQKISDPVLTDCPACGQTTLKKKISVVAFRLKGSGWYETDFKKEGQRNVVREESSSEGGGEGATQEDTAKEATKKSSESTATAKESSPSTNSTTGPTASSASTASTTASTPSSTAQQAATST